MDTEFCIQDVNRAFERVVGLPREMVVGQPLFETFPDNPAEPAGGAANLSTSLEKVLRTGRRQWMSLQRYDVPRASSVGAFDYRVRIPLNMPLVENGRVVALLNHSQDVTAGFTRAGRPHPIGSDPIETHTFAESLLRQFPQAHPNIVLSVFAQAQQQVVEVTGVADLANAVKLTRLRLEARYGEPAHVGPDEEY